MNIPNILYTQKFELIKNRNFRSNMSKIEKEHEIRENSHRSFSCLAYTHHRCQKIAANIRNFIKYTTSEFKLIICLENIRLSNFFSLEEKNGTVYNFNCHCSPATPSYIGESKRQLYRRICEHNRIKDSLINVHIQECNAYKSLLSSEYGVSREPSERR